jgi:hypothetical protein
MANWTAEHTLAVFLLAAAAIIADRRAAGNELHLAKAGCAKLRIKCEKLRTRPDRARSFRGSGRCRLAAAVRRLSRVVALALELGRRRGKRTS